MRAVDDNKGHQSPLARVRSEPGGLVHHDTGDASPDLTRAKTFGSSMSSILRSGTVGSEKFNSTVGSEMFNSTAGSGMFSPTGAGHVRDVGVADEIQKEEEAVERLRERLLLTFETIDAAFAALDYQGLGTLTFEELRDSLDSWDIDIAEVTGGVSLRKLFGILDIDGSGTLSLNELMETVPWRLEDEGILLLRQKLKNIYGTRENVIRAMDTNENGFISYEELRTCLQTHSPAGVDEYLGLDLSRIFNILDYDFSGELSLTELLDCDPRKEAALRDEAINSLRRELLSFFKSQDNLMSRLDANMNGKLSFGEFKDGLDRCRFDYKKVLGNLSLLWVFNVMDFDRTGDLSIHDLLEANSVKLHMKAVEAKRQHRIRRKVRKRTHTGHHHRKSGNKSLEEFPPSSNLDASALTPALQRIATFGLGDSEGTDGRFSVSSSGSGKKGKKGDDTKMVSKLDMSHCYIGEAGAGFLANSMLEPRFAKLHTLQLRANYIGIKATIWIACACERLMGLRSLGLSWNHIEDTAAARLASMVTVVKSLRELDVSFNRIGTDGAQKFSKAFLNNKTKLEVLDLRFNSIEKPGVTRLRAVARKVVDVRLEGNVGGDSLNENPVVTPRVTAGEILPKISDVVVAGWPRKSTTREGRRPHRDSGESNFSKRSSRVPPSIPCTPSMMPVLLPDDDGSLSSRAWPAASRLASNLSEAALTACGERRIWSRSAIRRHRPLDSSASFSALDI